MQDIIPSGAEALTMSSREIADLVGSRHDNVKRTIETLAEKGVIAFPQTEEKATAGRPAMEYVFSGHQGKRDSLIVVAQLCPEFTAKIVDRWQELEQKLSAANDPIAILNNPAAMRNLLLSYSEKVLELQSTVEAQAPKVAALDAISASDETMTFTQASKVLGLKRNELSTRLHALGWIYRQNGSWVAYDKHIRNGNLIYKEARYTDENTGQECYKPYCHITSKGLTRIAETLGGGMAA